VVMLEPGERVHVDVESRLAGGALSVVRCPSVVMTLGETVEAAPAVLTVIQGRGASGTVMPA